MISALASESLTSSGRSRSKRSVGRLSKSLTNACNSVNVFASIAFITIDDVGTFSFLASAMSIISPAYFSVGRQSDSNIRAAAHPIITGGRTAVRYGDRTVILRRNRNLESPRRLMLARLMAHFAKLWSAVASELPLWEGGGR